jgi:hypothetical protein
LRRTICALTAALALALCACARADEPEVVTLYRNSAVSPSLRIHVATFDSAEGRDVFPLYNRLNCEEAADLYNRNDPEGKRWWCEPGRFRP